jgi:hypothetical protein
MVMSILALAAVVSGVSPSVAQLEQAHSGRIDIYVVDSAFDLGECRGSPRTRVASCSWLGEGKERTGVSCEKRLGREWEEIWVEFVPEGDGEVDIDLQGEYYRKEADDDIRLIWADTVTVEGAEIVNSDFEEAAAHGTPVGWRFTGGFPSERYSRDGSVAHSGRSCVAVWYGSQARQTFAVERDKTYRVRAWFRVLDPEQVQEPARIRWECPVATYTQELEIEFRSEQDARNASLAMLPLYDGCEWAISSRWDDNNTKGDLELHQVLLEHGHRGTWYLNQTDARLTAEVANKLLEGGNSIGGHSLSHPFLTYVNRNRVFEEVAGIRADREASTDTHIVSYAFSFCDFRNSVEGDAVHIDIARALERAGYYNIANHRFHDALQTDMTISPIMPSDGQDIDDFAEAALKGEWFQDQHPNLSYSMHAWYSTPEAWAKFGRHLDQYGHNPNWWYCNQNQYAAYRYQYQLSKLDPPVREGNTLRLRLQRPVLLDVNDPTPLTFELRGVPKDAVSAVRCATADCPPSLRESESYRFHLAQDRDQALPHRIGLIHNRENRGELSEGDVDPDFPKLRALLHVRDGALHLSIENGGAEPLSGLRVTYRLPLAWRDGVVRRELPDIGAGERSDGSLSLTRATDDYKHNSGRSFFLAQIDFVKGGEPGRLYAACHVENRKRDASYPQGGFFRLGPIPDAEFDPEAVAGGVRAGRLPSGWPLKDGQRLEWVLDDDPLQPPYLDVEVMRTTGRWRSQTDAPFYYLLHSTVHSRRQQAVGLLCVRGSVVGALLNGADAFDAPAQLKQGANELVLIYRAQNRAFGAEHAGCFLRLVKPGTQERLTDIRFGRP